MDSVQQSVATGQTDSDDGEVIIKRKPALNVMDVNMEGTFYIFASKMAEPDIVNDETDGEFVDCCVTCSRTFPNETG